MISNLRLQQFRSYDDATFEFSEGVNIIVGPNGSGKTNLLEAILVVAHGSSYRVNDLDLLQFGAPWLRLDAHTEPHDSSRTVKLVTEPRQAKTYELDGKTYQRLSIHHLLPVVLFEPTTPGYTSFRRNYRRVLSQRNALLKRQILPSTQELFPWNLRLSELGATIARSRMALCMQLDEKLGDIYTHVSAANTKVAIAYTPKFPIDSYETHLLQKLESHAQEDAIRGFTAYGPHREDFVVTFDGRPADEFASRGETRTAILTLKIIELQLLEVVREQTPLLLLDDVFSELDGRRRHALTDFLQRYQTFLTTTDADVATQYFTSSSARAIALESPKP
jgi:DNA replication and repair protein RecF